MWMLERVSALCYDGITRPRRFGKMFIISTRVGGVAKEEEFSFAIPVEICKKLEGTMKIDLFTNQVTYARIK